MFASKKNWWSLLAPLYQLNVDFSLRFFPDSIISSLIVLSLVWPL